MNMQAFHDDLPAFERIFRTTPRRADNAKPKHKRPWRVRSARRQTMPEM